MQRSASNAQTSIDQGEPESVVVHVQLRPRRGATKKCLAALAALAGEHEEVSFAVSGLSKDDRIVRVTVGIDLGLPAALAPLSARPPPAQPHTPPPPPRDPPPIPTPPSPRLPTTGEPV